MINTKTLRILDLPISTINQENIHTVLILKYREEETIEFSVLHGTHEATHTCRDRVLKRNYGVLCEGHLSETSELIMIGTFNLTFSVVYVLFLFPHNI